MTMSQDQIGRTLLRGIIARLEAKGSINIDDIANIFEDVAESVNAGDPRIDDFVRTEITKLATFISEAKSEIFAIVPDAGEEEEFFNAAGQELNAVVKSTEEATNTILDAADAIMEASAQMPEDGTKAKINDETIKIFDACSFQDITGQRITKVIKTLEYVEAKVAKLAKLFGSDSDDIKELAKKDSAAILRDDRPDAELMGGPQLPGNAVSQDDIDRMFGA